jgi:hypothetical protein
MTQVMTATISPLKTSAIASPGARCFGGARPWRRSAACSPAWPPAWSTLCPTGASPTCWARLLRRRGRPSLPLLREVTHDFRHLREVGEQFIPVASSVGSVDGASQLFDRSFRPVSKRARARLGSILVATRQGEPLPPIEVYAWHGQYYVLDGHHRVAAARAVGSDFINAHVIEVG